MPLLLSTIIGISLRYDIFSFIAISRCGLAAPRYTYIAVCYCIGSLSVVSNTTDNSISKPADSVEQGDISSLPEYGMRPIDRWKNNQEPNDPNAYDTTDYPPDHKVTLSDTHIPEGRLI